MPFFKNRCQNSLVFKQNDLLVSDIKYSWEFQEFTVIQKEFLQTYAVLKILRKFNIETNDCGL